MDSVGASRRPPKTVLNFGLPVGKDLRPPNPARRRSLRLLVIEDEDRLSGILKSKLGELGFTVDIAASAADATAALELINYDAAVLDLGLPDGDGLAVLTAARQAGKALPILILTARDAVEDKVAGLNAGADDYLTKPFAMSELIARINALLRRPGGVLGIKLEAGNVRLDTVGRELTVARDTRPAIPPRTGNPRADDAAFRAHRAESCAGGKTLRHRRGAGLEPDPGACPPPAAT